MSAGARGNLRGEQGQTLVFFVLTMSVLFVMLALVVNVGAWLRAQREAQSVADTSALAAVHDPANAAAVAQDYADQNWPEFVVTATPSGSSTQATIAVEAKRDVPALFGEPHRDLQDDREGGRTGEQRSREHGEQRGSDRARVREDIRRPV